LGYCDGGEQVCPRQIIGMLAIKATDRKKGSRLEDMPVLLEPRLGGLPVVGSVKFLPPYGESLSA
jgi:hypothetical protein